MSADFAEGVLRIISSANLGGNVVESATIEI
jgi:hypothetical protein